MRWLTAWRAWRAWKARLDVQFSCRCQRHSLLDLQVCIADMHIDAGLRAANHGTFLEEVCGMLVVGGTTSELVGTKSGVCGESGFILLDVQEPIPAAA